jgi:hypothetical protein
MSVNSNLTASQQTMKKLHISTFLSFIAGVVGTGDKPLLLNIATNFRKNSKWPPWYTKGPGETDS